MGVDERVETGSLPFCKWVRMALSVVVAFSDLWVLRSTFTVKNETARMKRLHKTFDDITGKRTSLPPRCIVKTIHRIHQ